MASLTAWMGETRRTGEVGARAEQRLIERAVAGNREAFDALMRLHFAEIYGLIHRLVGNHEDAEDLTQDCFVKAYRSLRFYRGDGTLAAWLGRIAVHLARDHQRSRGRRARTLALEMVAEEPAAQPESVELSQRELLQRVGKAVEDLPHNLRVALVLRVFEGRDYAEVARVTGMKLGTVRTQVMKARRLLMHALRPWHPKEKR